MIDDHTHVEHKVCSNRNPCATAFQFCRLSLSPSLSPSLSLSLSLSLSPTHFLSLFSSSSYVSLFHSIPLTHFSSIPLTPFSSIPLAFIFMSLSSISSLSLSLYIHLSSLLFVSLSDFLSSFLKMNLHHFTFQVYFYLVLQFLSSSVALSLSNLKGLLKNEMKNEGARGERS